MTGIPLNEIDRLEPPVQPDDDVIYFLQLFRHGHPLQKEDLTDWMQRNLISVKRVKEVIEQARKEEWITVSGEQLLYITPTGAEKSEER